MPKSPVETQPGFLTYRDGSGRRTVVEGEACNQMKKVLRRLAFAVAAVLILLLLGTLVPRPLWRSGEADAVASRRILLLGNPIHTDIAIPLDAAVLARFDGLVRQGIQAGLPGARYLVFGWGSRAFYIETPTWSDLKPGPLLTALTIDSSVMHVDVIGAIVEPQPFVTGFDLSEAEFGRLLDFIDKSFRPGPDGPVRVPDVAYGEFDGFFEANGYFNALAGCNTWTARALRETGLQTGWWNPLPQMLAASLALHN
jgi:uncharacterized protein (TIGR02117 family)